MKPRRLLLSLSVLLLLAPKGLTAEEVEKQLPEISWQDAAAHYGEECVVVGRVVLTKNIGKICFLNFHRDFSNHFTAVIRREHFERFEQPPEILYADKYVKITGTIVEYQGKPEIVVTGPEQITILNGEEAASTPGAPVPKPPVPTSSPSPKAPPPPPPVKVHRFDGTVTIASYNVLNLFDDYDDPYHSDEGTRPKPTGELENLAATIHQVNADVIVLPEVENRGYLEQFNKTLLGDLGYEHVVSFDGNDERGIEVAVLSRLPVGPVTSYRHVAYRNPDGQAAHFRRDLIRVRVEPPKARHFDVFAVHFKSKRGGEAAAVIRMGEATAARQILDEVLQKDPEACFVFCGDLNDTFDSGPVQTLVGEGSTALQCFFKDIPEDQRITFNKEPYRSMIDFILCSPAMAARYQAGSHRAYPGTVESSGSDHNPISASFNLR